MYTREEMIKAYSQAVRQCAKILNDVDTKFHTYGEVEIDNKVNYELGNPIPQYTRQIEWRRILVQ